MFAQSAPPHPASLIIYFIHTTHFPQYSKRIIDKPKNNRTMKKVLFSFAATSLTLAFVCLTMAMQVILSPDFGSISKALGKGDAVELSRLMDGRVDLALANAENTYERTVATNELRKFFTANTANSFQMMHQGVSPDKVSHYCIGDLTAGGKSYRVFVVVKQITNQFLIQEMRIEKK